MVSSSVSVMSGEVAEGEEARIIRIDFLTGEDQDSFHPTRMPSCIKCQERTVAR